MTTQHPRLARALAANDAAEILSIAFGARAAQDEGRYCDCASPLLTGADLMCGACLLNNRYQEVQAVRRIVKAHDFEPSTKFRDADLNATFCGRCMNSADAPRHHGVSAVGQTSWGLAVAP